MIPVPSLVVPSPGTGSASPVTTRVDPSLPASGYTLDVRESGAEIAGGSDAGVFYGSQTLRQLTAGGPPPLVHIEDAPRFGWRGVLLDVARQFVPVGDVLRFVDLLAYHKLNVLHLHLTDDQGWRLSVPGRPRLTAVGAWRPQPGRGGAGERPHGGYYTDDDLRRIVAYAAARHVTVVPEVDMPGHMQAAIAAYPDLGHTPCDVRTTPGASRHVLNLTDATLDFCRAVLDHLCALFPSPVIGIGGDGCPVDQWRDSPVAMARIGAFGLDGLHALQPWFTARMAEHLRCRGRRVYGRDDILDVGAPPDATVATWRGPATAVRASRGGHDVVSCPDMSAYLDARRSAGPGAPAPAGTLRSLRDVYAFDPVPPGAVPDRILGAQANLWAGHLGSAQRIGDMAFPGLCAFAEVVWGPAGFADFTARLPAHLTRLDALGVTT